MTAILVVDDSLTVRMNLAHELEAAGLRPLPCATLCEARRVLETERVSAAVIDLLLPDGDGLELMREMRDDPRLSHIPVLVLSSEAEVKDRIRGLRTGADDYVGKPYDSAHVVQRVRELIERDAGADRGSRSVLVIDDSLTYRRALSELLTAAGYDVLEAGSGEEGLRVAAAMRPSAVVVDSVMPGMDGATVIRRLRLDAALRATICLMLTGSEHGAAETFALDCGADAFARKSDDTDLVLARLAALLRREPHAASRAKSLLGPKKILAVDDSPTYLNQLAAALATEGYDIVLAHSGEEALELLAVQRVDCILLDVLMPGLGGQETCRRVKDTPGISDIPLIMLTALDDAQAMIFGLSTGADDYISKAGHFDVLKARVRAQLRRRQLEEETRRIREELLQKELEASEARAARTLAEARAQLVEELERKNRELEAFTYSVSHDLRAPLRAIDGFSAALLEEHGACLPDGGLDYVRRVRAAALRMSQLIEDLLSLSRIGRTELAREQVDLAGVARSALDELARRHPERRVEVHVEDALVVHADARLMRVVLENLLANAWKFTAERATARIEVGRLPTAAQTCFVRDNGAGFDPAFAHKLFQPFQRLHSETEFPGTGIGLATVHRVIERHGGTVWAESRPGAGATFFFELPATAHPAKPVERELHRT